MVESVGIEKETTRSTKETEWKDLTAECKHSYNGSWHTISAQ